MTPMKTNKKLKVFPLIEQIWVISILSRVGMGRFGQMFGLGQFGIIMRVVSTLSFRPWVVSARYQ